MASCCCTCLWQQRLLFFRTTTFNLQTSRCKTIFSKLLFGCTRSISVVTHRRPCRQANAITFGNNGLASILSSQRSFLGYSTHLWPQIGANCVPRHLSSSLRGVLVSLLHTGCMVPAEEKKDTRPKSEDGETHGSVLMEMIKSHDQQPKQLTVGARGMHNIILICTLFTALLALSPGPPMFHCCSVQL